MVRHSCFLVETLILVLASSLRLLAALDAGALVVFLLPQVGQDASLGAGALEALESSIQRLVLFDVNFRHSIFPSLRMRRNPLGDQTFCFNSGIIIVNFTIVKSGILFTFRIPYVRVFMDYITGRIPRWTNLPHWNGDSPKLNTS